MVGQISDLLNTSASAAQGTPPNPKYNSSSKPWFGHECKSARTKYHLAKKMHKRANSATSKINLIKASRSYKKVMNKHINNYKRKQQNKLRQMQTKDPKAYWKYINSLKGKTSEDMPSVNAFFEHFSKIYTHDSEADSDFDISNVGKLFTSLLSDRLSAFLEDNEILYNNQAGFRKNFSTNDHIFSLYAIIELLKFEKKKNYFAHL